MLPGVTQVHVVADRHHQAALVIVNPAPLGGHAVPLVSSSTLQILRARYLVALNQIEHGVKDRILAGNIDDTPVGEHAAHTGHEHLPFTRAVKVVTHEESAAQQVL